MAQTSSNPSELGTKAIDFTLPDVVSGKDFNLFKDGRGIATLIMFICNHCPYVKHVMDELVNLGNDYQAKGVKIGAINSNDTEKYPEDSPANMKELALSKRFPFPYLFDESQDVAKKYDASCTPDFYIFDEQLKLVYRGQLDNSRPKNQEPVTGKDIRDALNSILEGKKVSDVQFPSIGCNIKWK